MTSTIEIFPWNENFATGIVVIDEQHRKLIGLLNVLVSHLTFQSEAPEVDRIIKELKDYAAVHFATEEAIWHEHFQGDPWEMWHRRAHVDFVDQVIRLNAEKSSKPLDEVIEGIVTFLTHWLALHIIESDKRMAKVVLAIPSGCSLEQAKKTADQEMSGATRTLIETVMTMYDKLANHTVRMTREIFKRKQTEQALLQTQEELRMAMDQAVAANLSKSEFLAKVSHELRTPLQGLLGYAELLTVDETTPDERADCARVILDSGKNLLALVDELLDHARISAGKVELVFSECKPEQLLVDVAALFARLARNKGVEILQSWQGSRGQRYLMDELRVRQMLSNLVSNAVKFTESGFITIEVRESQRSAGQAVLHFSVTDTGIGIKPEFQSHLFKRFEQDDSRRTQHGGGSGLGLSIVRELAELMGGETGIESEVNRYTTAWFSIRANLFQPDK